VALVLDKLPVSWSIPFLAKLTHYHLNVIITMILDLMLLFISCDIDSQTQSVHNDELNRVEYRHGYIFEERHRHFDEVNAIDDVSNTQGFSLKYTVL